MVHNSFDEFKIRGEINVVKYVNFPKFKIHRVIYALEKIYPGYRKLISIVLF